MGEVKYLESATVYFMGTEAKQQFPSVREAMSFAESHVGNRSYSKPFPDEETYLYGPGDGSTTVMIRQDVDMDAFMGRNKEKADG